MEKIGNLSDRAKQLLLIVEKATIHDDGKLLRFYVPTGTDGVSGAGDANCLRSLERKGLIKRMSIGDYSYAITEEGCLIAQTLE